MSTDVDVLVAGGGPAGAAVAYHLATHGHRVVVCERKHFPREKTCGDGLGLRAVAALREMGLGPDMASCKRVRGVPLHRDGTDAELPFPMSEVGPRPDQAAVGPPT